MHKSDRGKTLYTFMEMQTNISKKTKELSSANDSIVDLELKLTMLKESLEISMDNEKILAKILKDEKDLLESATATYNDHE